MPATSLARNPRTSRRMRTASWRGAGPEGGHEGQGDGFGLLVAGLRAGRRHAGPALKDGVGNGSSHTISPSLVGSGVRHRDVPLPGRAPAGRAKRLEARLVAIRYSQVRTEARPSNPRGPARHQAASPAARPRRPGRIRASGSSAPAAPGGTARSAHGTPRRPGPRLVIRSAVTAPTLTSPLSRALRRALCRTSGTDPGRGANWAAGGRLVSRPRGLCMGGSRQRQPRENRNGKDRH